MCAARAQNVDTHATRPRRRAAAIATRSTLIERLRNALVQVLAWFLNYVFLTGI